MLRSSKPWHKSFWSHGLMSKWPPSPSSVLISTNPWKNWKNKLCNEFFFIQQKDLWGLADEAIVWRFSAVSRNFWDVGTFDYFFAIKLGLHAILWWIYVSQNKILLNADLWISSFIDCAICTILLKSAGISLE